MSGDNNKINQPQHYLQGQQETWDAITGMGCGYLDGNVVKYMARFRYKGDPLADLLKARAYIDKLIEQTRMEIRAADAVAQKVVSVVDTNHPHWPFEVSTSTGISSQAAASDCAGLHHDD